ncbi:MAG TPA: hypothetical protein VLA37_01695, partial [Sphingomonadaceae bacterium]|nr:hypothetical protein [Sphingomonadaceae bacterium]
MMEERSTRSIASRLYLAGFLTAMLAAFLFETGLYFGSPYGLSDLPGAIGSGIALLPFAAIPVAIFTFVFLWPLTAIASQFCERIDEQRRWQVWVACGAAMGIPAMWFFAAI